MLQQSRVYLGLPGVSKTSNCRQFTGTSTFFALASQVDTSNTLVTDDAIDKNQLEKPVNICAVSLLNTLYM